jgi:pilus assembly protein CpaD
MAMQKLSAAAVRTRANTARAAALAAVALLLSGCYALPTSADGSYPLDARQRHPIAIREGDQTLDLFIGVRRDVLTAAQRAQVAAFAHRWSREATGGMIIHVPVGTGNAAAASGARDEVRTLLLAAGVPSRVIAIHPYRPEDPARFAPIRLAYPRVIAEAGPCGLWPNDIGPSLNGGDYLNREYWNFGCANQRNLAAMVDDPADLVQPRAEGPAHAARRAAALEKYRKGEDPSTIYRLDRGRISDIAP